jgi:hypothetical protein
MRQIDMSAEAVTARLKLASQLRRLCLSLGTAKIKTQHPVAIEQRTKIQPTQETAPKAK